MDESLVGQKMESPEFRLGALKRLNAELAEKHSTLLEEVGQLRAEREAPTLGEISDELHSLVLANGPGNFGTWWADIDDERWSFTMQREHGQTPCQRLDALDAEVADLKRQVAHWQREYHQMADGEPDENVSEDEVEQR